MDADPQRKREQELEKRLRTPKSVISRERFNEADIQETTWLINTFLAGRFYLYEPSESQNSQIAYDRSELEEIYEREQTLSDLKSILKEWIVAVAKETGMEESLAKDEEARIFPFGSHRLGVNSRGGDIDTLVLCPSYVDRNKHFFEDLFNILQNDPNAEELVKVNDPRVLVPVIKMTYRKIPIDLAFAKMDLVDKKLKNLNDNDLLATMDEKMVYSVNGPRNVDMIIQSVDPKEDPAKISNFRTTLKLLKLWAKNKGIYSNAMGYVTGISLAILVAKICQLFPNLKPNKLVQKFFQFYSIWNWDEFPVKIEEIKVYENLERFNDTQWFDPSTELGMEKINQKKKDDYTSPMMVITPAFPVMNSTRKVTRTNLDIIKEQLLQGKELVQHKPINWHKLFEKIDFFNLYNNFIEVTILANDEKEFHRWSGLIESQMIVFTKALETKIDYQGLSNSVRLHPYPVGFDKPDRDFKFSYSFYYGLKYLKPQKELESYVDLSEAAYEFIYRQMGKREEGQFKNVNMRILHLLRKELSPSVFGQDEEMKSVDNTTKNLLGKRPLEGIHENEFEPNIIKKVLVHGREDNDVKSANFTNSTTGSPHEEHDSYGMHNNGIPQRAPQEAPATMGYNKENVEEVAKRPQGPAQTGNAAKLGMKSEGAVKAQVPTTVLTGKTNFKPIDTSSLLKQSNELDDFL